MSKAFGCPKCKRPVANRNRAECLYCGAALPEQVLFSPEERAQRERRLEQERAQSAAFEQELTQLKENLKSKKTWYQFWKKEER
jgi:hypothetical protein